METLLYSSLSGTSQTAAASTLRSAWDVGARPGHAASRWGIGEADIAARAVDVPPSRLCCWERPLRHGARLVDRRGG
jgi:hypothetical protein